jgi:hypothetical protein
VVPAVAGVILGVQTLLGSIFLSVLAVGRREQGSEWRTREAAGQADAA